MPIISMYMPSATTAGSDASATNKERLQASTVDLANSAFSSQGLVKGRQVRVINSAETIKFALFTIRDNAALAAGQVTMTPNGLARLGTSGELVTVSVDNTVIHPFLSDAEAEAQSEFVERSFDDGLNHRLIVIAPHGGKIEEFTDDQAERVRTMLGEANASVWLCKGWKDGGGAFARWHITSTDIHEDSFPLLKPLMSRGFLYAVSFHGWEDAGICIGGSACQGLKNALRDAIQAVLPPEIHVHTDADPDCPPDFSGSHPQNIVNRLATYGVQIEQSFEARENYGLAIADAVASLLGEWTACPLEIRDGPEYWWESQDIFVMHNAGGDHVASNVLPIPGDVEQYLIDFRTNTLDAAGNPASTDSPQIGASYGLWTAVRNCGPTDLTNIYVRFYWARATTAPRRPNAPDTSYVEGYAVRFLDGGFVPGPLAPGQVALIRNEASVTFPLQSQGHVCLLAETWADGAPFPTVLPDEEFYPPNFPPDDPRHAQYPGNCQVAQRNLEVIGLGGLRKKGIALPAEVPLPRRQGKANQVTVTLEVSTQIAPTVLAGAGLQGFRPAKGRPLQAGLSTRKKIPLKQAESLPRKLTLTGKPGNHKVVHLHVVAPALLPQTYVVMRVLAREGKTMTGGVTYILAGPKSSPRAK